MKDSLRVLQVEDSESDAGLIVRLLQKAGYEVHSERVEEAGEMRAALGREAWDVIIADNHLPLFNAAEALKVMQEAGQDIPFIVVSGNIGHEVAVAMMKAGARDYIPKNDVSRLAPAVEREIRVITGRHRMEQALRDHTARLEELTRTLDLAHAIIRNLDGTITYWSQGAAGMYGWSPEEAAGRYCHELLKTEFPSPIEEIQAALLSAGRWEGELRHYRCDGTAVVVASHWALHYDSRGNPRSIIEVNNDISEQKRVEGELRTSEQRLELAQAAAGIGAWDWDISANETYYSDAYWPLFGVVRGHHGLSTEQWFKLIHPDDQGRVREELQRAVHDSLPYDTEFRVVGPDGSVRWLMGKGQVYRDASAKAVRMLGVNLDITDRKTADEQLRALSASLISAQEDERRRISRELHDDLTQRLCLMAIDLGKLTSRPSLSPAMLVEELRFLQQRAVEAAELARHFAHELHPSILEDLGIETALRSYCDEVARREEIAVEFTSSNLPQAVKRESASCLYAVAKEGLLNISKHARARRVAVDLTGDPDSIRLVVSDDGIGFASDSGAAFGLGIVNMRERVRWVNGRFSLESQSGRGTRISVDVPI